MKPPDQNKALVLMEGIFLYVWTFLARFLLHLARTGSGIARAGCPIPEIFNAFSPTTDGTAGESKVKFSSEPGFSEMFLTTDGPLQFACFHLHSHPDTRLGSVHQTSRYKIFAIHQFSSFYIAIL